MSLETAHRLYIAAQRELDDEHVPSPADWIQQRTKCRRMYERWIEKLDHMASDGPLGSLMSDSMRRCAWMQYYEFMHLYTQMNC
jgi:hypothetical protein